MTAKEYLGQAYRIDQRINSKLEQVASLRSLATKATTTLTDMPSSGTQNVHRMEDIITKIIGLENQINADIDKLVDIKKGIMETIQAVPHADHRTLLELRYICCKTWEDIAGQLCVSIRSVHRIHGDALCEINIVQKNFT